MLEPRPALSFAQNTAICAIAPSLAVLLTNPFDTIKVRLQLQGERLRRGGPVAAAVPAYASSWDCLKKTLATEGLRGLQKGLVPAVLRESSKNIWRLVWKRVLAGSICGTLGAVACNPFELIKTRLQSAGSAVGHQHNYSGPWGAARTIYDAEGLKGFYKGSLLSMVRSILGSGSNLATFSLLKEHLIVERAWKDDIPADLVSGLGSGFASVVFMNPVDVLRTRYYNQSWVGGVPQTYSSGVDVLRKIIRQEGWGALYKGFVSHFLRIGPHFCLTFVFLGVLRRSLSAHRTQ